MASPGSLITAEVTPAPASLAVGSGTSLFVDGAASVAPGEPARGLEVALGEARAHALGEAMPLPGETAAADYWWGLLDVDPVDEEAELPLLLSDRSGRSARIGDVRLHAALEPPAHTPATDPGGEGPLVAVCMATYEPDPGLLVAQIESIRAQSHGRWICLISDDGSGDAALARVEAAIDGDPRFALSVATDNAGFYGNFERALSMVPPEAEWVALCDQDDRWHPRKLELLLGSLRPGSRLAYSDIRLVGEDGGLISDTYWTLRRNNYTDFGSLVLANTVTGAATIFDAGLLGDVLPFPPAYPGLFHDHWIAQVAMALGPLSYCEQPLIDYTQHPGAALGHFAANGLGRYSGPLRRRAAIAFTRARSRGFRPAWRGPYFNVALRIELTRRVLLARLGDRLAPDRRAVLEQLGDPLRGPLWLLRRSPRDLVGANETLGRERAILAGLAWRRLATARARVSQLGLSSSQRS